MADAKVSVLTDIAASLSLDDLLYVVNDPAGTPASRRTTVGAVIAKGALVLLEQHTAAASASLDFTSCISSTYDEYVFEFVNILPATSGALLWMRMGTGAGPTFDTGANYSYRYWRLASGTAVVSASAATKIILTDASENSSLYGIVGRATLYQPQSTSVRKMVSSDLFFDQTGGPAFERNLSMGIYDSTTAVTGLQFLMSSGNITSGTIRCYGLAK